MWELWIHISMPGHPTLWRKSLCTYGVEITCWWSLSLKAALWKWVPAKINDCRRPVLETVFVLSHAFVFFMVMQCVCAKAIKQDSSFPEINYEYIRWHCHICWMENKKERAACNKIISIEAVKVPMVFHLPFESALCFMKVPQLYNTGNKD